MDNKKENLSVAWSQQMRVKALVLFLMCFQNATYTLLRRYLQGMLKNQGSPASMLLAGELTKLCVSLYFVHSSAESTSAPAKGKFKFLVAHSVPMVVPALVYLAMNILSYVSLARIDAGTFTVMAQMKLLTTAVCSVAFLGRSLSMLRWRALLLLVMATMLISLHDHPVTARADAAVVDWLVGVAAVLLEVTLSGFVSVYFEKVLKGTSLTLWDRNAQLATYSCFVYYPMHVYSTGHLNPFVGWSWVTCLVSLLGAAGGLLVAMCIKYMDSIIKSVATSANTVLTMTLGYVFQGAPLSLESGLCAALVILAIFNYNDDPSARVAASGKS